MTAQEIILIHVAEECNEVSHRACKALRFGIFETQEGFPNNAVRLMEEFSDLIACMELLWEDDKMPEVLRARVEAKKERMLMYHPELSIKSEEPPSNYPNPNPDLPKCPPTDRDTPQSKIANYGVRNYHIPG